MIEIAKSLIFFFIVYVIGIIIHSFIHYLSGRGGCNENIQGRAVWKEPWQPGCVTLGELFNLFESHFPDL